MKEHRFGDIMSSKESKIYLVLLALAYVAFNVGMFIFSAQHVITNFGPYKGVSRSHTFYRNGCVHDLFNRNHSIHRISIEG